MVEPRLLLNERSELCSRRLSITLPKVVTQNLSYVYCKCLLDVISTFEKHIIIRYGYTIWISALGCGIFSQGKIEILTQLILLINRLP